MPESLWTIQDVAVYFNIKPPTAYKLVNRPNFPPAVIVVDRRWVPEEVKKYALRQRAA